MKIIQIDKHLVENESWDYLFIKKKTKYKRNNN